METTPTVPDPEIAAAAVAALAKAGFRRAGTAANGHAIWERTPIGLGDHGGYTFQTPQRLPMDDFFWLTVCDALFTAGFDAGSEKVRSDVRRVLRIPSPSP